jgi:hypothetical protein
MAEPSTGEPATAATVQPCGGEGGGEGGVIGESMGTAGQRRGPPGPPPGPKRQGAPWSSFLSRVSGRLGSAPARVVGIEGLSDSIHPTIVTKPPTRFCEVTTSENAPKWAEAINKDYMGFKQRGVFGFVRFHSHGRYGNKRLVRLLQHINLRLLCMM